MDGNLCHRQEHEDLLWGELIDCLLHTQVASPIPRVSPMYPASWSRRGTLRRNVAVSGCVAHMEIRNPIISRGKRLMQWRIERIKG